MSFFQKFGSFVENVKEFYSEINAATLTGAIDVIVVEQQDGTFLSSPFHVRFGKLGVLKAREKIVDLEVNGEPVELQMKLDDTGAAFFVEAVAGSEEPCSPELATSPIPDTAGYQWRKEMLLRGPGAASYRPRKLQWEGEEVDGARGQEEGKRGQGKKKRRVRKKGHARQGSKSSLQEIRLGDPMFAMDDVNDAEGETEDELEGEEGLGLGEGSSGVVHRTLSYPLQQPPTGAALLGSSAPAPHRPWLRKVDPTQAGAPSSLVGARILLPKSSSDLENFVQQQRTEFRPQSVGADFHYFSDDNTVVNITSLPPRPPSPGVLSDSELEVSRREDMEEDPQNVWRWGELPYTVPTPTLQVKEEARVTALDPGTGQKEMARERSWFGGWRKQEVKAEPVGGQGQGCYLEDVLADPEKLALYLQPPGSSRPPGPPSPLAPLAPRDPLAVGDPLDMAPDPLEASHDSFESVLQPQDEDTKESHESCEDLQEGAEDSLEILGDQLDGLSDPLDLSDMTLAPSLNVQDLSDVTLASGSDIHNLSEVSLASGDGVPDLSDAPLAQGGSDNSVNVPLAPGSGVQDLSDVLLAPGSDTSADVPLAPGGGVQDLSDVPLAIEDPQGREEDCESGHGPSLPMSPHSGRSAQAPAQCEEGGSEGELGDLPSLAAKYLPDLAASLCGGLDTASVTLQTFEQHALTYEQFVERLRGGPALLEDPALVVRVHEKYLSWARAAPILVSVLLFRQPLPEAVVAEIVKDGVDVNVTMSPEEVTECSKTGGKKSWFGWWATKEGGKGKEGQELEQEQVELGQGEDMSRHRGEECGRQEEQEEVLEEEEEEEGGPRRCRKTLRLSSEKLAGLNLRPGSNEVEFSVTTAFQGTTVCRCHVYLWSHTDKVVISDIDGTITKSDVLGHILPVIGRDWAQSGVAQLFSKIRANGYHIMYLSARAIGQASMTKEYLESVRQGEVCLPDGPVFLNPDSLLHALKREVYDKNPEEFKIRCLKDIQSLYPGGKNPFFAGYGNKPNDAYAYRIVGIPVSRIFTINPSGELKQELTPNFQTSYTEQDGMVDQVFPPIGKDGFDPDFKIQEFSTFGFWKEAVPEVALEELAEFAPPEEQRKKKP